jgi:preprotein translocase subunit SecA
MVLSQIKSVVLSELAKNKDSDNKELIEKVNKFLEIEAIDTIVEKQDIEAEINNPQAEAEYIADIALEEFEKIKQKANSQEEFYDLERRIVLSSIDELWMRHIDAMSKLREEVAFE